MEGRGSAPRNFYRDEPPLTPHRPCGHRNLIDWERGLEERGFEDDGKIGGGAGWGSGGGEERVKTEIPAPW